MCFVVFVFVSKQADKQDTHQHQKMHQHHENNTEKKTPHTAGKDGLVHARCEQQRVVVAQAAGHERRLDVVGARRQHVGDLAHHRAHVAAGDQHLVDQVGLAAAVVDRLRDNGRVARAVLQKDAGGRLAHDDAVVGQAGAERALQRAGRVDGKDVGAGRRRRDRHGDVLRERVQQHLAVRGDHRRRLRVALALADRREEVVPGLGGGHVDRALELGRRKDVLEHGVQGQVGVLLGDQLERRRAAGRRLGRGRGRGGLRVRAVRRKEACFVFLVG